MNSWPITVRNSTVAAAKEMLTFIGFCEQNWPRLSPANPDSETLRQMQRLLDTAHTVAGDSIYTQRIELVREFTSEVQSRLC